MGFEPTVGVNPHLISNQAPSAARSSLRARSWQGGGVLSRIGRPEMHREKQKFPPRGSLQLTRWMRRLKIAGRWGVRGRMLDCGGVERNCGPLSFAARTSGRRRIFTVGGSGPSSSSVEKKKLGAVGLSMDPPPGIALTMLGFDSAERSQTHSAAEGQTGSTSPPYEYTPVGRIT